MVFDQKKTQFNEITIVYLHYLSRIIHFLYTTQRIPLISLPFMINWRHYFLIYHAGILVIGWLNLSQYLEWISGFQGSLVITEYFMKNVWNTDKR